MADFDAIDFDPAKDTSNLGKHGVSLTLAADLDWARALIKEDGREYGERRFIALLPYKERLMVCVYTLREPKILRVISLRKANNREEQAYDQIS